MNAADGAGAAAPALMYSLKVDGVDVEIGAVSMGNPHAVLRVSDVKTAPVARFGPSIEHHPRFPKRTKRGLQCKSWIAAIFDYGLRARSG